MPTPESDIQLVDRQQQLDECCEVIAQAVWLPLDTEFVRTSTFRPELCLVQIGMAPQIFCIDMLAGLDVSALWRALDIPAALKIVHAAKQDLEVLLLNAGALPGPLFDTQIAAGLLGHPPQAGYAKLVEAELGVRLDKTQTRTDWSQRPLSAAQLAYAADDVAYLPQLYQRLRERLQALDREAWALEDSAALLDPALYVASPEDAWERLPGLAYQPVEIQARARSLAAWRERRADTVNRPRQWVLTDQALMALAAAAPADLAGVDALNVVPPGAVRHCGSALLAHLRSAEAALASGTLALSQQVRTPTRDNGQIKALAGLVQKRASELNIAPEILATRGELTALLRGSRDVRVLNGWRREAIGQELLATI